MADFFLGVLAILAGLVFCFSGYLWLRIALPVWGAFVGFAFGSGLMLVTGPMDSADFTREAFADRVDEDWWWYVALVALALGGTISQLRDASAVRRNLAAGWTSSPA